MNSRNSNDCEIKNYYKKYCKVLADVIKLHKEIHYNNLLVNFSNTTKTTWNIISENINKRLQKSGISFLNINGITTHNRQVIANTFNTYFSTVAQHTHIENFTNSNSGVSESNPLRKLKMLFVLLKRKIVMAMMKFLQKP